MPIEDATFLSTSGFRCPGPNLKKSFCFFKISTATFSVVEFLCSIALINHLAELNASDTNFLSSSLVCLVLVTLFANPSSILIAGKVDLFNSTFHPFLVFSIITSGGSILKFSSAYDVAGFGLRFFIIFINSDSFSSFTLASLHSF